MIVNLFPSGEAHIISDHLGTWEVTEAIYLGIYVYNVTFTPYPQYVSDSNWSISSANPAWASDWYDPVSETTQCKRYARYTSRQSTIVFTATRADNVYSDTYTYTAAW